MKERGYIEKLWREEKYNVLYHSQQHYNYIRELLKQSPTLNEVQLTINEALQTTPSNGSIINAYDHMWGYFKHKANEIEKNKSAQLKADFKQDNVQSKELLIFIKYLADKYKVSYLQKSTLLNFQWEYLSYEKFIRMEIISTT